MLRSLAISSPVFRREPTRPRPVEPGLMNRGPGGEVLDFELVSSDGVPSLDTLQHRSQMNLLLELTDLLMADRGQLDYFAAGDTFLYYSVEQARYIANNLPVEGERPSAEYRALMGPDYFFVPCAPWREGRQMWVVWEEQNRYPQVAVELSSPSTVNMDRTVKKSRYERVFQTAEYYMYRPGDAHVDAYHLGPKGRYRKAVTKPALSGADTASDRWIWSAELEVWLGLWRGVFVRDESLWLRFYDIDGQLIPTQHERIQAEKARRETAEERAGSAEERAESAEMRAQSEKERAESAEERAESAEKELQQLRALLAERSIQRN